MILITMVSNKYKDDDYDVDDDDDDDILNTFRRDLSRMVLQY